MGKSNSEKIKDALLYAPVGAYGFMRDNVPTFFSMFVSRGKRDVNKTTSKAEETISTTKERGQIVAMGSPIYKKQAEKIATDAKSKGEEVASFSIDVALSALGLVEGAFKTISSAIGSFNDNKPELNKNHLTGVSEAASQPEAKKPSPGPLAYEPIVYQQPTPETTAASSDDKAFQPMQTADVVDPPSFHPDSYDVLAKGEGSFVAEPVDPLLPAKIKEEYEILSAPEIIDRLDDFAQHDLQSIKAFEQDYRNRQTIIHAINYRLNENL